MRVDPVTDVNDVTDRSVQACAEALAQSRGAGPRIIGHVEVDVFDADKAAFVRAADTQGYLVIDAHLDAPEAARRRCWHRHVMLVHRGQPTAASIRWIRELSTASPRAHAVLVVSEPADRVCESVQQQIVRPLLSHRIRGRKSPVSLYLDRRQVTRVLTHGRRQLSAPQGLLDRSQVVAEMANVWLTQGLFETAVAALAGVDVECHLRGMRVPSWIRERQAEAACWLGEWDVADHCALDGAHDGWRAVVACARRDWNTVRKIAANAVPDAGGWPAVVAALGAASDSNAAGVAVAIDRLQRSDDPPRWRDALALECLRMVSADAAVTAACRRWRTRPRGRAEALLWRYVTRAPGAVADVQRMGAQGVRRWGLEKRTMEMWVGVSSLLQLVHDAEDAAAALRRGCRWARDYTGVDFVAIVGSTGQVLASDPDQHGRAISALEGEPVRYGGTRIGGVILIGTPRDAGEARAVADALATACAPSVRTRLDEMLVARAGDTIAGDLLGASPAMAALRDAVARAAASTYPVLIEGESGTGKELVARAVHRLSARRDRRWAAVNCAALTDELFEAELFGHTRGAFTGAVGPRAGLLEDAHEGTLFLDEVAELSPRGQAKLLRVLQEGEIRRVGENQSRRVDVRVVTATNRSLDAAVRQGVYREDLVFRLAVIRLRVPPLRNRIEDVPLLAHAFWQAACARVATRAMLTPDAVAALCRYGWPGNVRELQNVIAALAVGGPTRGRVCGRQVAAVLADRAGTGGEAAPISLAAARRQSDQRAVTVALARHAGQRAAAARELGVSRQGLAKLISRLAGSTGSAGSTG